MSNVSLPSLAKTLSDLNAQLEERPASRLTFVADDLHIDGSYHVTEIKSGTFVSLDCGGNPDTWEETILQVEMSADPASQNTMTTAKLAGILEKVASKVGIAPDSRLTIEAGTAGQPMRVYDVGDIRDSGEGIVVGLYARSALCKPRHREIMQDSAKACCSLRPQPHICCCQSSASSKAGACCAA